VGGKMILGSMARVVDLKGKARWQMLKLIYERGKISSKELIHELKLARSSILGYLSDLEELGLIKGSYETCRNNISVKVVEVTEKGRKFLELLDKVEKYLDEMNRLATQEQPQEVLVQTT
jgi:DNA-binding MarR family transcriptional regulator